MSSTSCRRLAAIAVLLILSTVPMRAADAPPAAAQGELWEVTSQMSMEGSPMAMPSRTQKVCTAKDWKEPPAPTDERQKCVTSDFKVDGPKVSWKTTCAGKPPMTGVGEITRDGADAYSGQIKFSFSEGNMTMKMNGKKVGACELPAK